LLFLKILVIAGSWECKDCYTRNNETAMVCVACQGPSPNANKADSIVTPLDTKPLSQMFKVPGSWECKQCSVINNQTDQNCSACEFPKDMSIDTKPKLSTTKFPSDFGTPDIKAFSFGIPQVGTLS
jgi:E3 SUMO-protein ligase RanBP2